jgi:hypothetical protein
VLSPPTPGGSAKLARMTFLATDEGVSVILVMLCVGLIFLAVIAIGELTHRYAAKRSERRRAQRSVY